MCEIDPSKLINAVRSRPALYSRNDPMYNHRKHKNKMWNEVCVEILSNWKELKAVERVEYVRDIQRRWKSLRTCFTRELKLQRREKFQMDNCIPVKKRKKYGYFNELSFLAGETHDMEINKYSDEESDPLEGQFETEVIDFSFNDGQMSPENIVPEYGDGFGRKETAMKRDEEDDDKQFVMSLIPMFRKLSDRKKVEARIEVMKVLQKISFEDEKT